MREFCKWVSSELSQKVPVHFTRFHPDYKMKDVPATPLKTMHLAHRVATEEGLQFPYLGNIGGDDGENTYCPKCKTLIIRRYGFSVEMLALIEGKCAKCGQEMLETASFCPACGHPASQPPSESAPAAEDKPAGTQQSRLRPMTSKVNTRNANFTMLSLRRTPTCHAPAQYRKVLPRHHVLVIQDAPRAVAAQIPREAGSDQPEPRRDRTSPSRRPTRWSEKSASSGTPVPSEPHDCCPERHR